VGKLFVKEKKLPKNIILDQKKNKGEIVSIIEGKIKPLNNNILVSDMSFEERKTLSGIIIQSDDGKEYGIRPRWARVWATGPEQKDVSIGEWILIEHGRWSRGINVKQENGEEIIVRRVDPDAVLLQSDEKPNDI
jgi:co-chaperonin GroES (HSP10)